MISIIHCAEDSLAAYMSSQLVDRFVAERAAPLWLREFWAPVTKADARTYTDLDGKPGWSNRTHVKNKANTYEMRKVRAHPRGGLSGLAALAYKCARVAAFNHPEGDYILLLSFDTDGEPDANKRCRRGLDQAATTGIVAEATPEFDAWLIAGHAPANKHQQETHRRLCKELGFDPLQTPERLTSTINGDPRDAKRLCRELLGVDGQASPEHPEVCQIIEERPLELLESNGRDIGCTEFFDDIRKHLLPLLGDIASGATRA